MASHGCGEMGLFKKPQQNRPRWFFREAEGHRDHSQRSQEATSRLKTQKGKLFTQGSLAGMGAEGGSLDFVIFSLILARYWKVALFKEKINRSWKTYVWIR